MKLEGSCDNTYEYIYENCSFNSFDHIYQSAFAGSEVCQRDDFTSFLLNDNRLVHIYPQAAVEHSWLATREDTSLIVAIVDSVRWESVLGLADSVKHISFHEETADTPSLISIRIGKTLGLLDAIYFWNLRGECKEKFALTGISTPQLGLQYASPKKFLTPNENQELHFEEKVYGGDIYHFDSTFYEYKEFKLVLENFTVSQSESVHTYTYRGSVLSYRGDPFNTRLFYDTTLQNDYVLTTRQYPAELDLY